MPNNNILITGGTDGMGLATAIQLATMGATLLLVGRNREKGEAAISEITGATGKESVAFLQADLSLVREMQRAAEHVRQTFNELDVLVLGAGGVFPPKRTLTDEGLEVSFAVQYLARFVLTNELLDPLRAAPAPQVFSIAGGGGYKEVDFDNLNGDRSYNFMGAISQTAAECALLTLEQITRYPEITFYNYGPGMVRTKTLMPNLPMRLFFTTLGRPFTRTAEQATDDIVALLTGEYPSGLYGRSLKRDEPAPEMDAASRTKLWDYSETVVDNILMKKEPVTQTAQIAPPC